VHDSHHGTYDRWMAIRGGDGARSQSFESTLSAAQVGAKWASTALWEQYAPAVAGFLRARGSFEPDDLTSEVFLALFEALPTFEGNEPALRSFIFSIAYRRLVDELRQRARRGASVEFSQEVDDRLGPSAETEAVARLDDAAARALLDDLPTDQRDVLVLRIVADLTIEQIAAVLDKRPGAVKALQRRALERLKKKLGTTRTLSEPPADSSK
jgi:RNA polymerase sigma-70 factor, ECF subfamily